MCTPSTPSNLVGYLEASGGSRQPAGTFGSREDRMHCIDGWKSLGNVAALLGIRLIHNTIVYLIRSLLLLMH